MAATSYNLTIEQGIPFSVTFTVKNPNGSNKDLTGYTARMQLRSGYLSSTVALEATTANTKISINTATSTVTIDLTEDDTKSLSYNNYVYDLELVSSTTIPLRLVQGNVIVSPEVTKT